MCDVAMVLVPGCATAAGENLDGARQRGGRDWSAGGAEGPAGVWGGAVLGDWWGDLKVSS